MTTVFLPVYITRPSKINSPILKMCILHIQLQMKKKKDNANINSTLRLKQAVQINVTHNLTTVLHPFKISELTGKVQKYYAEF